MRRELRQPEDNMLSFLWSEFPDTPADNKRRLVAQYIGEILEKSDWTQLPDAVLTPLERENWTTYREQLISIYFSNTAPDDVILPDPPAPFTEPTQAILDARARRKTARATIKAIPNWATWTQADWDTYFNTNLSDAEADLVTSLASARVMIKRQNAVIKNLVKLVIGLRDHTIPDLPD